MTDLLVALVLVVAALLAQMLLADGRRLPRPVAPAPLAAGVGPDAREGVGARVGPGAREDSGAGAVSIVIPARNEAATLPFLLASLQHLTHPPGEVVVVDDASDDGTAEVARGARAVVIAGSSPPPGWTGKAWACHQGAAGARGSLLLFLDADTTLEPDALERLLLLHRRHGGLVSVQPHHDAVRGYEQLSAYFNLMSLIASGAFSRHRLRRPMAFGPVLLTSRADYVAAGGHAAVRAEILDDVQLAAAYSRQGLSVHCYLGGEAIRMRMYAGGPAQMAEGWSKNIASGASAADPWCSLSAGLWLASHWAVTVSIFLSLGFFATQHALPEEGQVPLLVGHPLVWVIAWLAVSLQMRALLRRVGSFRWWVWAAFPLPLLAFTVLFVRSSVLTSVRREVTWRGRTIGTGTSWEQEG